MSMKSSGPLQLHKVVVVGHVDHGKSTLLGRILLECGRVPEDRIAHVQKICSDKSLQFEPAFYSMHCKKSKSKASALIPLA